MNAADTGAVGGARTLLDVLDAAQDAGFDEQFIAREDGTVRCDAHTEPVAADRLVVHDHERLEGASDAADELVVVLAECPDCGARGTLTLGYGPNASPADAAVLVHVALTRP